MSFYFAHFFRFNDLNLKGHAGATIAIKVSLLLFLLFYGFYLSQTYRLTHIISLPF